MGQPQVTPATHDCVVVFPPGVPCHKKVDWWRADSQLFRVLYTHDAKINSATRLELTWGNEEGGPHRLRLEIGEDPDHLDRRIRLRVESLCR